SSRSSASHWSFSSVVSWVRLSVWAMRQRLTWVHEHRPGGHSGDRAPRAERGGARDPAGVLPADARRLLEGRRRADRQPRAAPPPDVVKELRIALTVENFDEALAFYRDTLGLEQLELWEAPGSRAVLLSAGRATLELFDEGQAAMVDDIEVGRR